MQITLSITNPEADLENDLLTLEVYSDMTLETLRSSIHAETGIHPTAQHLYHNGNLITDNAKTMEQLQIGDSDMLALHVREARGSTDATGAGAGRGERPAGRLREVGGGGGGGGSGGSGGSGGGVDQDPELIRLQILGNPTLRAELQGTRPELIAALQDPARFARVLNESVERERRERAERQRRIAQLNADPFDVEAQAKIEEIIRQERVMENLQNALEHNPEVFGRVHLLYVDVEVNKHKFKALVDSGAQATIMSPACAEACGIMRLVDKRFAGVARGVGTATIIGRVHSAPIKIGDLYLPCSFTVMEGRAVELLLGLDMLKRHQACIDLGKGKLVIQGKEIDFLGEADIPKDTEEAIEDEPTLRGPGGTTIGQRSGVVSAPAQEGHAPSGPSGAPAPSSAARAALPAATAATAAAAPAPAAPPADEFPNEKIEQLMALGFSRDEVISALRITGGNVEFAASMLLRL